MVCGISGYQGIVASSHFRKGNLKKTVKSRGIAYPSPQSGRRGGNESRGLFFPGAVGGGTQEIPVHKGRNRRNSNNNEEGKEN